MSTELPANTIIMLQVQTFESFYFDPEFLWEMRRNHQSMAEWVVEVFSCICGFTRFFFPFSHQYDLNFHKYPVKGKSFKKFHIHDFANYFFIVTMKFCTDLVWYFHRTIWLDALLTPHYNYLCTYNFEFTRQSINFCKLVNEWKNL